MKVAVGQLSETMSNSGNENGKRNLQAPYEILKDSDLVVSRTNPRRRVNEGSIKTLAKSIRSQGILEPLIVRKLGKGFEIVCGERRFRAAKLASLTKLPCIIRELSDEQVLDIQIHENLHREDIHPMDEAAAYQFLKEKLDCSIKELALRVGQSENYVLNRLKLVSLIEDAQNDIDRGDLPLRYGLELAKYSPEIQTYIYSNVYRMESKYIDEKYIQVPIKGEIVPWKSFLDWISINIHRLLASAPFDPTATNLRRDGLVCAKCPERTGAAVSLFEPNQIGKKDACLNPHCYLQKAQMHVEVLRAELAYQQKLKPEEVPIVRSWCYSDGKDYFGTESAAIISGAKRGGEVKSCSSSKCGVDIEPENYGKTLKVCLKSSQCKVHWGQATRSLSKGEDLGKSAVDKETERLEAHRARREEIWNAKVAESVRVFVFKEAAEKFEMKFRFTDVGKDLLCQLILRFWQMTSAGDPNSLRSVVSHLLTEWNADNTGVKAIQSYDMRTGIEQFKKLEPGLQIRVLFLLVHGYKGAIFSSNNYTPQKEVKDLAEEFDIDYKLLDAEARVRLGSSKYSNDHQTYLNLVKRKEKGAVVPRLYSEKWKPGD